MVFDCLKPSSHTSWTRNSFPGGKSHSHSMLFGPVLSPYMSAAALPAMTIPASTPMFVPMQMSAHAQTIPVPVAVQQPSPVVTALPQTYTVQIPQPAPHVHVPSPVIRSSIPVPQPQVVQSICHGHHPDQHQQGSPGNYTVNLYVNTPEHQSRQLDDRSPPPTLPPQLWEQQQQWQQHQEQEQRLWQYEQQRQQQQWQERQLQQQQQWRQQQLQQRGRPQSARPPTAQPPTPSSVNINLFGPQPRLAQPGTIYLQTPTPPPAS